MRRISTFAVLFAAILSSACSSMQIQDFEGTKPEFVLEQYFAGKTRAYGVVHDRNGKLRRQFVVDIKGDRSGDELVLTEDFLYSDGETDQRIWRIKKIDEHTYEGTAADVIGVAEGKQYGNALQWRYAMNLKMGDDTMKVRFNDWMYLMPGNVLINRAIISKWGVDIAEVVISFTKNPNVTPDTGWGTTDTGWGAR